MGEEEIKYEPLLDNIDTETLMKDDDFEIDTGSRDGLHGVKLEDPVLKDKGNLAARERPWTSVKKQIDGRSRHERTSTIATKKEAAIFDSGHMVIDSANETTYW